MVLRDWDKADRPDNRAWSCATGTRPTGRTPASGPPRKRRAPASSHLSVGSSRRSTGSLDDLWDPGQAFRGGLASEGQPEWDECVTAFLEHGVSLRGANPSLRGEVRPLGF